MFIFFENLLCLRFCEFIDPSVEMCVLLGLKQERLIETVSFLILLRIKLGCFVCDAIRTSVVCLFVICLDGCLFTARVATSAVGAIMFAGRPFLQRCARLSVLRLRLVDLVFSPPVLCVTAAGRRCVCFVRMVLGPGRISPRVWVRGSCQSRRLC